MLPYRGFRRHQAPPIILQPEKACACVGQAPNAVLAFGAVENGDGPLHDHHAGVDTCLCLARARDLVDLSVENTR